MQVVKVPSYTPLKHVKERLFWAIDALLEVQMRLKVYDSWVQHSNISLWY